MTTSLPPAGSPAGSQTPAGRSASRVIAILTAALGAAVIVGTVWGGVVPTVAAALTRDEQKAVETDGVTRLDIDVSATSFTLRFADVDEATLEVHESGAPWTLERDGGTLRVETPRTRFGWWFWSGNGEGVLTLPQELEGIDADLASSAGSTTADGTFGELVVEMSAGEVIVTGAADSLTADVSAGRADFDLEDVGEASFTLSAGDSDARLSGTAPRAVDVSVSAGSLDLTLPDEVYDVTTSVAAGDVENGLRSASDAQRTVYVEVSAGNVRLIAD